MHRISIIVPIYNVEQYLYDCIESIINQSYQELEIILVDDGSTDSSPQICDNYAVKDSRIKVIHQQNGGLSQARNAGMQIATGDFISFVDSDDLLSINFYKTLLTFLKKEDVDIVECGFVRFKDKDELMNISHEGFYDEFNANKALELLLKEDLKQVVWNKLYKIKLVRNLYFEKGRIHEDEFWTYKIFARANKMIKISHPLYYYRQQDKSIMAEDYSIKRLSGIDAREERIQFIASNFPNLTDMAVKTFWYVAWYNYQAIVRTSNIDADSTYRKSILMKVKKNVRPKHYFKWKIRDILWFKFFLLAPEMCSKIRNFIKIGV